MRWSEERYLKLYTRDTTDWLALGWKAQGLFCLLLRKVDRTGTLSLGKNGRRGISAHIGGAAAWSEIEAPLNELLADGCVRLDDDEKNLLIPNFLEAQEAIQGPTARKQRERERRSRDQTSRQSETRDSMSRADDSRDQTSHDGSKNNTARDRTSRSESLEGAARDQMSREVPQTRHLHDQMSRDSEPRDQKSLLSQLSHNHNHNRDRSPYPLLEDGAERTIGADRALEILLESSGAFFHGERQGSSPIKLGKKGLGLGGLQMGEQERQWCEAWRTASQSYTLDDLRRLGEAIKHRRVYKSRPPSVGEVCKKLPDLLAEALAWQDGEEHAQDEDDGYPQPKLVDVEAARRRYLGLE